MTYIPTSVLSIQHGTITLSNFVGQQSGTLGINAVNLASSVVLVTGVDYYAAEISYHVRCELTNATTVTAYRISTATNRDGRISFSVLEFHPSFIKSRQAGVTAIGIGPTGTPDDSYQAINAVNTARSLIFNLGVDVTNSSASGSLTPMRITFANASTLTLHRENAGANAIRVGWQVLEFK